MNDELNSTPTATSPATDADAMPETAIALAAATRTVADLAAAHDDLAGRCAAATAAGKRPGGSLRAALKASAAALAEAVELEAEAAATDRARIDREAEAAAIEPAPAPVATDVVAPVAFMDRPPRGKLSPEDAVTIVLACVDGTTRKALALKYGVHVTTITDILVQRYLVGAVPEAMRRRPGLILPLRSARPTIAKPAVRAPEPGAWAGPPASVAAALAADATVAA